MASKVNMREEEYALLADDIKNVHDKQLLAIQTAITKVHTLLDADDGFHVDMTSAKIKQMLSDIEQDLLPALKDKFSRTEDTADQMIQEIQNTDMVR